MSAHIAALKQLDAIAALAGESRPTTSLADIDPELADLKSLLDRSIQQTGQLDAEETQAGASDSAE